MNLNCRQLLPRSFYFDPDITILISLTGMMMIIIIMTMMIMMIIMTMVMMKIIIALIDDNGLTRYEILPLLHQPLHLLTLLPHLHIKADFCHKL